jgi:predicted dehydrogenase
MKGRARTALIGAGFVGRVHLENLMRSGCAEVVALVSAPADLIPARKVAAHYAIDEVETDYRRVLEDGSIDAVHICTPNSLHAAIARDALEAGKHVLCEKPLATDAEEARKLVALAGRNNLRNCTCYNLRFYPLVQQMRQMCANGDLGEIFTVQGSYCQDWLLLDTDWNWRLDSRENGPSRTMADIGSHWCDMAEFITGFRITELCADLQTFHSTRKQPKGTIETFAGKTSNSDDYREIPVDTEDFGACVFRMGERTRGCFTASQVSAGRKNRLIIEVYGSKMGVSWDGENPNELWIGHRNSPNQCLIKDPSLLSPPAAACSTLPGGHAEGYGDTFRQVFRHFYQAIEDPAQKAGYPQFSEGVRQLEIVSAELESWRNHAWTKIPYDVGLDEHARDWVG